MAQQQLTHPDPARLTDYGLGRLNEAEAAEIYNHLEACPGCRGTVEKLADDTLTALVRTSATVLGTQADAGNGRATPQQSSPTPTDAPGAAAAGEVTGSFTPGETTQPGEALCSAASDTPRVPAALVDHPRYRVLEPLGAGGMGAVYKAEHRLMDRPVALKVINHNLVDRPGMVDRFRREVKAAARLAHPNIAAAYDAEQAGDTHFLVMEFIDGQSLAEVVAEKGPLPADRACEYIRQAALGLQHAFERGMVHRDIKPHNLMLTPPGQSRDPGGVVKVLDFGLAQFASEQAAGPITESGVMVGTPDYMAPEQARDAHTADIRADVYSLGCTLYFLLTGHSPFPGGTVMNKLAAHLERTPQPLAEVRRDLPPGLARVVERMLAKDPAGRYQTPGEVAAALTPFASPAATATRPPSRRRWLLVKAALLVGALGLTGARFGPAVYRIATNQGQLVIEINDPDIEVIVQQGGRQVKILDTKTQREVTLRAGTYQLELAEGKGGLRLSTSQFTLARGGQEIVKISKDPTGAGEAAAKPEIDSPRLFKPVVQPPRSRAWPYSVAFSPDGGGLAAASGGFNDQGRPLVGGVDVWDLKTGCGTFSLVQETGTLQSVAFSPDGKRLAFSGGDPWTLADGGFQILDLGKGQTTLVRKGPTTTAVAFSPDGKRVASATADHLVKLWNADSGILQITLKGHTELVGSVAFSPCGQCVASASWDKTVKLWDSVTGQNLLTLNADTRAHFVAFSPDGKRLANTQDDGTVKIWDVVAGKETFYLKGHAGVVRVVAFSPDGKLMATCSAEDKTVRLWNALTGKQLRILHEHTWQIESVAFSPDGKHVASGSDDGIVRVWTLPEATPSANTGQLVIETEVPEPQIILKQAGQQVRIIDPKVKKEIALQPGEYQVELAGEQKNLCLSRDRFTLLAGGRQYLWVQRVKHSPR